ncbi:hypothetical protein [Ensifer sp. ENS03]|uniref:hypothetical protein n=1 Tax=Ensifer sp. ENS03 TaxID=2769283 RepID=UPI001785C389|nr:hypothetical protein [Ensifer sp. ENS03]MBD9555671.1 hypothetical protein [Ensifer sp. ENS03]
MSGVVVTALGAAFGYLQLRGPKAKLSFEVFGRGIIRDGLPVHDGPLLLVSIVNTGGVVVSIDRIELHRYRTTIDRLMGRPAKVHGCEDPSIRGQNARDALPYELQPGQRWVGTARFDEDMLKEFRRGEYWFAIHTASRKWPHLRHIPRS